MRDSVFRLHDRDQVPGTAAVEAMGQRNLVYDVGTHKGEDAEFYLRKGFHVIGVEVDPLLVYSGASCPAAGAAWRFLEQRRTQPVAPVRSNNTEAPDLGRPLPASSLSPALDRRGRDRVARQLLRIDGALRPPARDLRRLLSARRAHPRILEVI